MKYKSINRLSDFEIHDTWLQFESYDNGKLVVSAKALNVHNGTNENPADCDMEIEKAIITIEDFEVEKFELLPAYQLDAEGNWYSNEPQFVLSGKEAEDKFIEALKDFVSLNGLNEYKEDGKSIMEIETNCGIEFIAICVFSRFIVEWDACSGKAWYEALKD